MTQPLSAEQVSAATNTLRAEASEWDTQSSVVNSLSAKIAGMEFGRTEAGLFQLMVGPYNEVIHALAARYGEGATAMTQIGATLRAVADTYEQEDQAGAHSIHNLY